MQLELRDYRAEAQQGLDWADKPDSADPAAPGGRRGWAGVGPAATVALRSDSGGRTTCALAQFRVVAGPGGERALFVTQGVCVLGRGDADLSLDADPSVSRRHARVQCEPGSVRLRDLGSRTGLVLNGRALRECRMVEGDRLLVGDTCLELFQAPPVP